MNALPARFDDAMLARLDAYGAAPLPALPETDETHIAQFLRVLSTMPRSQSDTVTGELRLDTALRMLGHLPRPAIDWMADQALRRFTFHPSIKEMLDLASEWRRDDDSVRARAKAEVLARRERQARLDDARKALRFGGLDQDTIDALTDHAKRILETEGLLWRCDCGSYVARPTQAEAAAEGDASGALARLSAKFPSARELA